MTAILESKAVFQERARALGVSDVTFANMAALGWETLGSYGFSCAYIPGGDDSTFKTDVLQALFPGPGPYPQGPSLRRLFYESYTFCAHDLKSKLDRSSDDPPKPDGQR